jgi:putative transposase
MQLVEQHIVTKSSPSFKKIDELCFLSKNLYNVALYRVKQNFLETGKWLRAFDLDKLLRDDKQVDFYALPPNTSQQILLTLDRNLKSYFALLKKYKKDKTSLNGCPKFPKYKDKVKGRNLLVFTINQARLKVSDDSSSLLNLITFPKKTELGPLKTRVNNLNQVRIIPKSGCYVIEVVYEKQELEHTQTNNWLSIDTGLNNLMTCYDSSSTKSFIINGKPLKSINQFYNKQKSKLQSQLEKTNQKQKSSKRLTRLNSKRNNKIKNYLHNSTRTVVNYCLDNNVTNLVIGHNPEWKTEINLGSKNNQNFVSIPHTQMIEMLQYKCTLSGISFHKTEESYTSKCSALDLEPLCKKDNYFGKRVKRGKYLSSKNVMINADLNGAMNILRKVTGDKGLSGQTQTSRGQVDWPVRTSYSQNKSF